MTVQWGNAVSVLGCLGGLSEELISFQFALLLLITMILTFNLCTIFIIMLVCGSYYCYCFC